MKKQSLLFSLLLTFCSFAFAQAICVELPQELKQKAYSDTKRRGFSILIPGSMVYSKTQHLDTCLLRVTYQVRFSVDSLHPEDRETDEQVLEIGRKVTKCFSAVLYKNDSLCTAMVKKGFSAFPTFNKRVIQEAVYSYSALKTLEVVYRMGMTVGFYSYSEPTPQIAWTLSDERKDIVGYHCQKATCRYRGRDYVAWYATDIPLRYGPYKFSGLPGLILAITDTKNEYDWQCVGIQKPANIQFVNKYQDRYQTVLKTTCDKVRKMLQQMTKDTAGFLKATGHSLNIVSGGKVHQAAAGDIPPEPFNPIEKE